jgi:serine/threonine protein kinase
MKVLSNRNLLESELLDHGYAYESLIEKKGDWTVHKLEKNRKFFQAKAFSKKHVFINQVTKDLVNRELGIAELIKKNFNYLVAFHDFFYTRSYVVIVYEYCPYGTIRNLLQYGSLQSEEVSVIMKDIFNGLEELKFLGIIHKNLCPDCIYIDEKFHLKIAGYEFCEVQMHKVMIPPDYLNLQKMVKIPDCTPPEVLFNQVCTVKAPLYSVGAILFACYNRGRFHMGGENIGTTMFRLKNNEFKPQNCKEIDKQPADTRLLLIGLLQISSKDRMSFVEVRDFINRIYAEVKNQEDQHRASLLLKVKSIAEQIQASIINGSRKDTGDAEMKKYPSIFRTPIPGPAAILKCLRNKGWSSVAIEETLNFAKNCKKSDIADEIEMKNFPSTIPLYPNSPRRGEKLSFGNTFSMLSQTGHDFSVTRSKNFRINDFKRSVPKRKVGTDSARETWMSTRRHFADF